MDVTFRRGTVEDSFDVFKIFETSLMDLSERQNVMAVTGAGDPVVRDEIWSRRKPLFDHLARTADEFWIAQDGERPIGYARSILRDNVRELTEFFVLPDAQSAGVGGELLKRAFPAESAKHRVIIATTDVRAQVRYLKAGVVPRFPEMYWSRAPENVNGQSDLEFVRVNNTPATLATIAEIDRVVLGHTRDVDHAFLLDTREGYLYRRGDKVVGYGYLASGCGPIALLDPADFDAVLGHAEAGAFARGHKEVGFDIPQINRAAVDYFLAHKYKLDSFVAFFMSDVPFGKFENYVLTSPAFFI